VRAALAHNARAESFVYPGIEHGFTQKGRPAFDAAVADLSFERAIRVLETLKTPLAAV
jgi:dienelactone hydrolase